MSTNANEKANHTSFVSKLKDFGAKIRGFVKLDHTKKGWRKVMSSIWAIVLGLIVAMIFIAIVSKNNPFLFFSQIVKGFGSYSLPTFYKYLLIFGFSGLACAIGFKSGLFNIGISGQMMISAIFSFSMFVTLNKKNLGADMLFLGLIGTIVLSFLVAMLAGALKAYLNVHEVITTILLNWIIVYLGSFIFSSHSNVFSADKKATFISSEYTGTAKGVFSISDQNVTLFMILGFVLLLVSVFAFWFILRFTTTGYKIKMLGISKTNGKYMGVNDKLLTMLVMGFSGALAGLAGFYLYIFKEGTFVDADVLQPLGFEAIAVSLLALNSPIGVLFTAIFYSTLYNGTIYITLYPLSLKADYIKIITALILYFAAISQILMTFKPGQFLWKLCIKMSYKKYWLLLKLRFIKRKIANLDRNYEVNMHKIRMNICKANEEGMLNKVQLLTKKYENLKTKLLIQEDFLTKKIAKYDEFDVLNVKINQLKLNNKYLYAVNKIQIKEYYATKISLVKKSTVNDKNQKILELKKQRKQDLMSINQKLTSDYEKNNHQVKQLIDEKQRLLNQIKSLSLDTTITFQCDIKQFEINEMSNQQKLQALKKEHNLHKDSFLQLAINKNMTSAQTLEQFSQIAAKKREYDHKSYELGKYENVDIKQQHRAIMRNILLDYKKQVEALYQQFMNEYFYAYFNAKGGKQ
ncbi:hypothetical protein MSATCC14277_0600 [Metamycoplasma salivarium]|uniref:ABC transporter permease n=1 Tax=Metamycoplasma salivarium TaxID=2124 RepID=UPI001F24E204|nr:ABC transporter permease [Metamycoplasma salivarium]GIZ05478.1 hypothetical protein MSATCC14277_0600 [Metamycoplasma salivarium]